MSIVYRQLVKQILGFSSINERRTKGAELKIPQENKKTSQKTGFLLLKRNALRRGVPETI